MMADSPRIEAAAKAFIDAIPRGQGAHAILADQPRTKEAAR